MDGVFRRYETPLIPERGYSQALPDVNAHLQIRIHSLFVSRHERYSPKTPRSSSDDYYLPNDPSKESKDSVGEKPDPDNVKALHPAAELQTLAFPKSSDIDCPTMGATRFDGASIAGDAAAIGPHRNPSQPALQTERGFPIPERRTSTASGLNKKAPVDLSGRESDVLDALRRMSSPSKPLVLPQTRVKPYNLRTLPPKVASMTTEHLRPSSQHVPGIDRSQFDVRDRGSHQTRAPVPNNTLTVFSDDCSAATAYIEEPSSKAVDALKKADIHALSSSVTPTQIHANHSSGSKTSPNPKPHVQHAPLGEFLGQSSSPKAIEPLAVVKTGSSQDLHEIRHTENLVTSENEGATNGELPQLKTEILKIKKWDMEKAAPSSASLPKPGDAQADTLPSEPLLLRVAGQTDNESVPSANGPQLSDLLKSLPPVRRPPTMSSGNQHMLKEAVQHDLDRPSKIGSHSSCSLQSIPLDTSESMESPVLPLLPRSSPRTSCIEPDQNPKISPVSRALSMLSEISARSGFQTPSSHSTSKHQKLEEDEVEGARHWVRKMLGRRSTSSVISPNLTDRVHYRDQRIKAEAFRSRKEAVLTHGSCECPGDEDKAGDHHGMTDTDDLLALRHQKDSQPFAKVIIDLESLLKEALSIADAAASREQSDASQANQRKHRNGYGRLRSAGSVESDHSLGQTVDEESHDDKLRPGSPCRDKQRTVAVESAKGAPHDSHFLRPQNAAPYLTSSSASRRDQSLFPNAKDAEPPFISNDWAHVKRPVPKALPAPRQPPLSQVPSKQQQSFLVRSHVNPSSSTNRDGDLHQQPNVQPRSSSLHLPKPRTQAILTRERPQKHDWTDQPYSSGESESEDAPYVADFRTSALQYHPVTQDAMGGKPYQAPSSPSLVPSPIVPRQDTITSMHDLDDRAQHVVGQRHASNREPPKQEDFDLQGRHHFSIREPKGFSLSRSHRRTPIARDWSTSRKRYVATVTCITTALMGLVIGVYAGEVPAIQYAIADEHHYTILGNVVFFIGLAVTTSLFYPLPLLHGRKPYTLVALVILLPLQFPQAWVVDTSRSPYVVSYRLGLLLPRAIAGFVMGFANINFKTTLLDLFGSSLQSSNPHQETVNENDVRRHGGGMGIWLSIWTWCSIGSIGVGFLIGAEIISGLNVSWGFWVTIILNAFVLLLNVTAPEVRRSPYRRSMAEVRNGGDVSRRIAKGEIKMHLESTGPIWWGEEVFAGHVLFVRMLKQPGFAILSMYLGWIYGQVVMIIVVSCSICSSFLHG